MPPDSALGDKGTCLFMWGPGCTHTTEDPTDGSSRPDGIHMCSLQTGHTDQCHCFDDDVYTHLGSLTRNRIQPNAT